MRRHRVEEAQATIAEMSERIVSLQDRLDVRATAMYRSGSTSYLDVLLGVSTFEDFATVWDTLNTLNAEDADLVASTKITKSTLESAQSELVEQQQRARRAAFVCRGVHEPGPRQAGRVRQDLQ